MTRSPPHADGPSAEPPADPGPAHLWARVLGRGEDPATWGWAVGRLRNVRVRMHPIVPVYLIVQILWSIPPGRLGPVFVIAMLASLALTVAAREAARLWIFQPPSGSILFWPLGILDRPFPGQRSADRVAWLVGATVCAASGVAAALLGVPLGALNPLRFQSSVLFLTRFDQLAVWSLFMASGGLTLLHLLPMPPFDGARFLPERLRPRVGGVVGLTVAIAGLITGSAGLVLVAAVGVWLSIRDARSQSFLDQPGDDDWLFNQGEPSPDEPSPEALPPTHPTPDPTPEEIDRLLARVSADGLAALTPEERARLDAASRRTPGHPIQ